MSSAAPSPSPTGQPQQSNNGGPTSSPLLFFVALGFGVVFTNLWIIVGVKYCFRYNQRNRAARAAQDGEPIDLAAMPRPHRRRREKKLMTMDEVNERFPLTKYKQWKSSRETKGLPTAGGIATAPQSRANSIKDVEGIVAPMVESSSPRSPTALSMAQDDHAANASTHKETQPPSQNTIAREPKEGDKKEMGEAKDTAEKHNAVLRTETTGTSHFEPVKPLNHPDHDADADDSDDDDPIRTAAAPEMLTEPGDTCAICIDVLEDDDDVRGLTCGHAFHASCLDPWLTSRRACCPLCKADYYVPKPRPEGDTVEQTITGRRSQGTGLRSPTTPQGWTGPFSRSRVIIVNNPSRQNSTVDPPSRRGARSFFGFGNSNRQERTTPRERAPAPSPVNDTQPAAPSWPMVTLAHWIGRNRASGADANAMTQPTPTPGQLEAGNRR